MVLLFLAVLIIMALTLFDILSRDPALIRLPRLLWVVLVILLPLIGVPLWFLVGRRREPAGAPRTIVVHESPAPGAASGAPTGAAGARRPGAPLSTEEQLAALEREIEQDRQARRIAELEAELRRRRATDPDPGTAS